METKKVSVRGSIHREAIVNVVGKTIDYLVISIINITHGWNIFLVYEQLAIIPNLKDPL